MRNRYVIPVLLAVVLAASSVWVTAQSMMIRPVTPTVISGENFGFRIEGDRGGTPVGQFVVKQDGKWVVAELGSTRLTNRISQK